MIGVLIAQKIEINVGKGELFKYYMTLYIDFVTFLQKQRNIACIERR